MTDFTVVFIKGEGTTRGKARIKCKPTDGGRAAMLSEVEIRKGLDACRSLSSEASHRQLGTCIDILDQSLLAYGEHDRRNKESDENRRSASPVKVRMCMAYTVVSIPTQLNSYRSE